MLIEYAVIYERPIISVFIIPKENKNCLGFCSVNSEESVAACPEPIPGRNEQSGPKIEQEKIDFRYSFFVRFASLKPVIFCSIGVESVFSEIISAEIPNNPESNGRRGCSMGKENVRIPTNPERRKIVSERKKFSSLNMI